MPLAQIYVPEGVLSLQQKSDIIKGVTEVIAGVENIPAERWGAVYVLVNEVGTGSWGAGGKPFISPKLATPKSATPSGQAPK